MRARPLHYYDSVVEGAGSSLRIRKRSELCSRVASVYSQCLVLHLVCIPHFSKVVKRALAERFGFVEL